MKPSIITNLIIYLVACFTAGFLIGIAAVAFYQIFGKPALPTEPEETTNSRLRDGGPIKPGLYGDPVDPPETFISADSLRDLGVTKPIKIRDDPNPIKSHGGERL